MLAFTIIEAASFLNISPSLAARFSYPINFVVGPILILLSILGLYGFSRANHLLIYLSLLTPLTEMTLSLTFLLNAFREATSTLGATLEAFSIILLGSVYFLFVSKTLRQQTNWAETGIALLKTKAPQDEYAVEVVNVTKKYTVGPVVVPAINGLTMRVRRGEFVAVMGPSGCGKSTLLNLIGALDRPSSGRVMIDGIDISRLSGLNQAQLRNEKVGFVFQAYNLINRSNVLRNVELPMLVKGSAREQRLKRIGEMLNVVGLGTMALRRPKTLSGGEQQRVAIARALVNSPKIVLADEPTGNLDSKAGMEILRFLRDTNKKLGTTVVVVTHNREAAEMADRIIYLKDGRIEKEELVRKTPK